MKSRIHLSESFSYSKILRFVLPAVVMNVCTSLYAVVDGFFIANFAGATEFVAVNLIMPVLNILGTIGYMFGVGGSVLVAKTLGEKLITALELNNELGTWISNGTIPFNINSSTSTEGMAA